MIQSWSRRAEATRRILWGVAALAAAACSAAPADFPTATALGSAPRRPDGVAVDLESGPPQVRARGSDDDGILTLRAPLERRAALDAVRAFFEAVGREDPGALSIGAQSGALVYPVRGESTKGGQALQVLWQQRFQKYDYGRLAGVSPYHEADVETYRVADLPALPLGLAQLTPQGEPFEDEDVVLRVPIAAPGMRIERLFGDEIYFWLRRQGERYLVHHLAEDFDF